jgi:glycosyltransferase involved in cell wall biosynthesis
MKPLFIARWFPVPANSGGAIATLETLRSIHSLCELHLLTPPPENDRIANEASLKALLPGIVVHYYKSQSAPASRLKMYTTALKGMLTGESYWKVLWLNRNLRSTVQRLIRQEQFDVVHCEWLQLALSLTGLDLPLIIRSLDVHFVLMNDWAESLPFGKLRKSFWRLQVKRFRRFEAATLSAAPAVVALSSEDEAILRDEGVLNIVVIPPPRSVEPESPPRELDGACLALFIGRLEMPVNREAFFLFADEVWSQVREEYRMSIRIIFAGGFPDKEVRRRALECGIEIHAPLSATDAEWLFKEADIFLSPLKSGTGIKVKTLEAMAHGKPVLGFRGAYRGINVENNKHALIVDSTEDFARSLERLATDADLRHAIALSARQFIHAHFDSAALGIRLLNVYSEVAQNYATQAPIGDRPYSA